MRYTTETSTLCTTRLKHRPRRNGRSRRFDQACHQVIRKLEFHGGGVGDDGAAEHNGIEVGARGSGLGLQNHYSDV